MNQPLSQVAAFKCREDAFQRWVERRLHRLYDSMDTNQVAEWLRDQLGVESRRELDVAGPARERFEALLGEYRRDLALDDLVTGRRQADVELLQHNALYQKMAKGSSPNE